jgi:glutamate dehydrogenase (NAD(P)+)
VSTVHGLLADPNGLDVAELFELRQRHGDRFVEHGPTPVRPREALFELDCDVLVPGARPDSITLDVAERVRCAVVAPGANVPYAPGAVDALHARGVVAVPDFVSNSGGVHLYSRFAPSDSPAEALAAIEGIVRESVGRTLTTSHELSITPFAAAVRDARDYLSQATGAPPEALDELFA